MIYTWKIDGTQYPERIELPSLFIQSESFDDALKQARLINRWYCAGQIVEDKP